MKASEVRKSEDGIWHLDLLGVPEEGADDDKILKTKDSHRLVAVHQDLIDLGFIEYVESPPASGQLFRLSSQTLRAGMDTTSASAGACTFVRSQTWRHL